MNKYRINILTVLSVVLLWGRGEGQDLPIDIWQPLRLFQSYPDYFLLRIAGRKEAHPLDTGNDIATGDSST